MGFSLPISVKWAQSSPQYLDLLQRRAEVLVGPGLEKQELQEKQSFTRAIKKKKRYLNRVENSNAPEDQEKNLQKIISSFLP